MKPKQDIIDQKQQIPINAACPKLNVSGKHF